MIKKSYLEKSVIEIGLSEETQKSMPIDEGYINLAIVKEEEQRKKENEVLDKASQKTFTDKRITSYEDIYGAKTCIELKNLFQAEENNVKIFNKTFNSILILGRAGIGKSTVCQYIAYQWAKGELWSEEFDLIVWIPLRNLMDESKYKLKKEINSFEVIYKECLSKETRDKEDFSYKEVKKCFQHISEDKILYVLDGYDEIAHLRQNSPVRIVISEYFLRKKHVILTSRPHYIRENPFSPKDNSSFQKVENIGFLDKEIDKYIDFFFSCTVSEEKSDGDKNNVCRTSLKQFFKNVPNAKGIAHIPINLSLICQAWKEHYTDLENMKNESFTLTELYQGLVHSLCIRYLKKFHPEEKMRNKSWHFISKECYKILDVLKTLAFQQMKSESLIINNKDIINIINQKNDDELLDAILNFGLLKSVGEYYIEKEKKSYYFIHLTFQEFLAAFFIADRLKENDSDIIGFISKNKYNSRYEIVWWFVSGILKNDEEALERFFMTLEETPRDMTGLYHLTLMMRCMDEIMPTMNGRKEAFIENLTLWINGVVNPERNYLSSASQITLNYLGLSKNIFNNEKIIAQFIKLLEDTNVKRYVANALRKQSPLPENIIGQLVKSLADGDVSYGFTYYAVSTLCEQSSLSKNIIAQLVRALTDTNKDVGDYAANALRNQSSLPENVLAQLGKLLMDKKEDARRHAAFALSQQYSLPEDIIAQLVKSLTDTNKDVRDDAAEALSKQFFLTENIIVQLGNLLTNEDEGTRCCAAKALSKQSSLSENIIAQLIKLLTDKDISTKRYAAEALREQSSLSENIIAQFEKLLANEDEGTRCCAAEALSKQSSLPENIIAQLGNLLTDKDIFTRRFAAMALSEQSSPTENTIVQLVKLLTDKDEEVRRSAAEALRKQSSLPEYITAQLVKLLTDKNEFARHSAKYALSNHSSLLENTIMQLVKLLTDEGENARHYTAKILSEQPSLSQKVIAQLGNLLTNEDEGTRRYAAKILSNQSFLPENIITQLGKLLADKDKDTIFYVASALRNQFSLPKNIITQFGKLLADKDKDIRHYAVMALRNQYTLSENIIAQLGNLLTDEDEGTRRYAAYILRNQSSLSENIITQFGKLLTDKDKDISRYTAETLIKQHSLPENVIAQLVKLLTDEDEGARRYAAYALSKQSISHIASLLKNNRNINLILVLILKSLNEKLPIYFYGDFLYIGNLASVKFDKKEKENFIIDFNKAFINLTGMQAGIVCNAQETITLHNIPAQEEIKDKGISISESYKSHGMLGKTPHNSMLKIKELASILAKEIFKEESFSSQIAIHLSEAGGLNITFCGNYSDKNTLLLKDFFSHYYYQSYKPDYPNFKITEHSDIITFIKSFNIDARFIYEESRLDYDKCSGQKCLVM